MIALVAAGLWGALVAALVSARHGRPAAVSGAEGSPVVLGGRATFGSRPAPGSRPGHPSDRHGGRSVLVRPDPVGSVRSRRSGVVVGAAVAFTAVVILGPGAALVAGLLAVAVRLLGRRSARRRRRALVDAALPDLVDLLRIAASAGHPVRSCIDVVAGRAPAPTRPVLARVRSRVARGVPLADALREAGPRLGALGPALVDALVDALLTGSALGPALERVAVTARDRRRRTAEETARRLPVTLLFPLVCCVLPAFGLLAVVPLLAASVGSLAP